MASNSNDQNGFAFFAVNDGNNGDIFHGVSGGVADLDYFRSIFKTSLGFEWKNERCLFKDITLGMWNHERDPSVNRGVHSGECCIMCSMKSLDYTGVKYILFGISTHGGDIDGAQYVQFFDGKCMLVNDIMEEMSDENIPQLTGTTRILVINACTNDPANADKAADRGKVIEQAVDGIGADDDIFSSTVPVAPGSGDNRYLQSSGRLERPPVRSLLRSNSWRSSCSRHNAQYQDFLLIHSTTPGRFAFNNSVHGSWMLHALEQVIVNHYPGTQLNLLQALTKAARIMSHQESILRDERGNINTHLTGLKAILYTSSTLTCLPLFTIQRRVSSPGERLPQPALVIQ